MIILDIKAQNERVKCIARYSGAINERSRANEGANKKINEQWLSRPNYRHIGAYPFSSLLLPCLNIYFPPPPVSFVISVTGEESDGDDSFMKSTRDYGGSFFFIHE